MVDGVITNKYLLLSMCRLSWSFKMSNSAIDVPPKGGFSFDLCRRNDMLSKKGVQPPSYRKTGTTIVGLVFQVWLFDVLLISYCYIYIYIYIFFICMRYDTGKSSERFADWAIFFTDKYFLTFKLMMLMLGSQSQNLCINITWHVDQTTGS